MEITKELIEKLDPGKVYESVVSLSKQAEDAWAETKKINIGKEYGAVNNLVMCGMGGSGLGARVIESMYGGELKIPLVRVNTYDLPGFVNENSLVVCSSYSGTTEETIENARQAVFKKARLMIISTGKTLIEIAKANGTPFYKINPKYNPSNQPRMAIGYSIIGQLGLAAKAGLVNLVDEQLAETISSMNKVRAVSGIDIKMEKNPAKMLADKMRGKVVVYVSAEHLIGATHTMNNQLNESAKHFSAHVFIPELNHHLMEGLKHPDTNKKNLLFIFVNSRLYPDRIQKRFAITREVIEKNGIETMEINLFSNSKLPQIFELIQLGGYVSVYLSILYKQNPEPVPWVDYFKKRMGQSG